MPSAAAASLRSLTPQAPKPPQQQAQQSAVPVPQLTASLIPEKPGEANVFNPETAQKEQWIADQLNPAHAAFVGNKYKPDIQRAAAGLTEGLAGFGNFTFQTGQMGEITNLDQAEQIGVGAGMGENYRLETIKAQAAANARGMLNSRMTDEAVGLAWSRLNTQKRDFFTRYATTVSGSLQQMQSEISGLTTDLLDMYGADIRYAMENPILGAETTPEAAASGAPTPPTTAAQARAAAAKKRGPILWHGKYKPTKGTRETVANRGYPTGKPLSMGQIQQKTRGGDKGYVIVRRKK